MATTKTVDSSLWWEPFTDLLTELESVSPSSDLSPNTMKKLEDNRAWLVESVSRFKPPNEKSKEALNSGVVKIGAHELSITREMKEEALRISSYLDLDEVQSYILVQRSQEQRLVTLDSIVHQSIHVVLLQYYMERQCLLKCSRLILMHALYVGTGSKECNNVTEEGKKLISGGLEDKLISNLENLLSADHPKEMDIDLFTLWAEEILIEDDLILDILFLVYYESLCTCNGGKWKRLCSLYKGILAGSYNLEKLAISIEALNSSYGVKVQLLLILVETLNLDDLLKMVHDETPFSPGASVFSLSDVVEMDALVSSLEALGMKEAGALILAWAAFLCLVSSLPGKEEHNVLMEIDHVAYVRQAFETASLSYFLEILQNDLLGESDGRGAGYHSVLRTFISAFIASYEINQIEDGTFNLILDILCKIYRGEESLCIQFWDKESFVDGPIRCFLCTLEGEFPFRTVELVRFLSSLCEGSWPSLCVYNFLNKSVGISSLFEISGNYSVNSISQIVETRLPLHVPGVEGLLIPSKTRGHVLKVFGGNTALVRWEYRQSAVLVLLLRLAQGLYPDKNEEALLILDLLNRMVTFNTAVRFGLMYIGNLWYVQIAGLNGQIEKNLWVVEIICTLIRDLSPNCHTAAVTSMGINILAKMLKCSSSCVAAVALKANIFDVASRECSFGIASNVSPSGWVLSGKLAKMLLIDCEHNDYDCPLAISVLDFTMQLVETGMEHDFVLALVVFSLQYILVNHEYWKFKVKDVRWKITLKVLEVMKTCIKSTSCPRKLSEAVKGMLLCDSSIHNTLFRIICTTSEGLEKLYVIRTFKLSEIEGLQLAICSVLDIIYILLSKFSSDMSSSFSVFHQAVLSSTTTPVPVIAAVMSLISYIHNPAIQLGAVRVLSMLLTISDYLQPYLSGNVCFSLDDIQIAELRHSVDCILQSAENEDIFVATVNLLTSAANFQPAFLIALFSEKEKKDVQQNGADGSKHPIKEASLGVLNSKKSSLVDSLLLYVGRSGDLINSNPRILLSVLQFLKMMWQGAGQYSNILEWLKSSEKFWSQLSESISSVPRLPSGLMNLTEREALSLAYKYHCQCNILEILAYDMFVKRKQSHAESLVKKGTESKERIENAETAEKSDSANGCDFKAILSSWCESSVLSSLIKSYTSCAYDDEILYRAKVAVSLLTLHLMQKSATGDAGSLSVSLHEKINIMSKELTNHAAFSQLLVQYTQRGYSEGKEVKTLILNDLYCHLQGELEGRKISAGPFKELSEYLIESKFFQSYELKYDNDLYATVRDRQVYDLVRVRADLGLDMWEYSEWKASKATADTMLQCMQDANMMVLLSGSKLSALKALVTVLTVYEDNSLEKKTSSGGKIPTQLTIKCIDQMCRSFHCTTEMLTPALEASVDILDFLAVQTELLIQLVKSVQKSLTLRVSLLVLRTSGFGLKVLNGLRSSCTGLKITTKHLLMLILLAVEFASLRSDASGVADMEYVEEHAEVCNATLGLLPILCHCITSAKHCTLSMTTVDLILRSLLAPNTWFPIIQQHLQVQHLLLKLQDKSCFASVPIILKFLLTLARVRGGAEMLLNAGYFSSLRILFSDLLDNRPSTVISNGKNPVNVSDNIVRFQNVWGLGLAVVAAAIHSLGESSSKDIIENVIPYFFSEKAYLISYHLSSPSFPSDDHDKKRPRAQKRQTSLTSLKETEHTLMLMCVLAKHWKSWVKAIKETDSQLRETSIHLLAFISRGAHRLGESPNKAVPLFCPPILKEELDYCKKPSIVKSKVGWFALTPSGCVSKSKFSTMSSTTTALLSKDQTAGSSEAVVQTYFSDTVALQMYKIAFLLLNFLCLQAEGAAKRAEEVGFVDLAHFPELPMPEILHGVQDQATAIVSELCEANKMKQIHPEIQQLCLLLLQITEMALNLELCVLQICGIRPVLGRVEDFSKEVKMLIKATEGHAFLKSSMKSLTQIISIVYPGLL